MKTNPPLIILSATANAPGALRIVNHCNKQAIESQIMLLDDPSLIDSLDADYSIKIICRIGPLSYKKYKSLIESVKNPQAQAVISASIQAFNKADSARILTNNNIAVPTTHIVTSVKDVAKLHFPAVFKPSVGNQGKGVVLVESQQEAIKYAQDLLRSSENFLAQEYIAESKGSDKRLIVVGDKVVAAMKRVAKPGDFRANIHLGASAEKYIPSEQEEQLARTATQVHGLSYAGVDIIDSSNGPLVLEVNPSPGFAISNITGINVISEIVDFILKGQE